jgi:hypothetical protein
VREIVESWDELTTGQVARSSENDHRARLGTESSS